VRRRFVTPLLVGALLLVPVTALVVGEPSLDGKRSAPALPTRAISGPPVTIEQLRGTPVIVHFWATWCGPCEKEGPEFARLDPLLRGRARLVAVDLSDRRGRAEAFVRRHRWRFPVLEDPAGEAGERYAVTGLPSTFIVDESGRIVRQLPGPQTAERLLAALRSALPPGGS
jgi:thiol-disulfide isomerase/thioredoxin